jgi:two-component system, OmpR family, sensor histidine kinase TctE
VRSAASLRSQLLRWLLAPLTAIWVADGALTYVTVKRSIDVAYDRALYGSALAISEHVTLGAGEPVVDLPPVALEMLDTGDQERVFYRVSYRDDGKGDTFITGYEDLPAAPPSPPGKPVYYEGAYRGDPIRVAALRVDLAHEPRTEALVQVAETLGARADATRALVARALVPEMALVAAAAALVWLGVRRGLRPLTHLSREVAQRSPDDLTPIPADAPREVVPIVSATNDLMARVRDAIAAQRRFIADASHQLRTPLAVLRADADAALREDDLARLRAAVARLRDHSQAAAHLATQLLALARAEPGSGRAAELEPVDLAALARETCAALVPQALERGVDLGFEGAERAQVRAQPLLLRELLANLVDNALRYGRPRGRITVSVADGERGPTLAVEDDGPGIPAAERGRVLERFYRIPGTAADGCGLGLAIVAEIARTHGAELELLDGEGGKGLRVELRFPVAGGAAAGAVVEGAAQVT